MNFHKQGHCNRVLDFFPVKKLVHRMVKIRNGKFKFSSQRIQISWFIRHTWSSGNDYDGKGPGFESDGIFFSNSKFSVSKKYVGFLFVCVCFVGFFAT